MYFHHIMLHSTKLTTTSYKSQNNNQNIKITKKIIISDY